MPRYGTVDKAYALSLATADPAADGPIYMLNLMKYRVWADDGDRDGPARTGREADDEYAPVEVLRAVGAAPVLLADVVASSEDWDRVGVVRYASRRSFIEMQSRDDFRAKHVHKEAGMDRTIVLGTVPAAGLPSAGDARLLLEIWSGAAPPPHASPDACDFVVEGTIIGDGRTWDGARYSVLAPDAEADLSTRDAGHQRLVLQPVVERWT